MFQLLRVTYSFFADKNSSTLLTTSLCGTNKVVDFSNSYITDYG